MLEAGCPIQGPEADGHSIQMNTVRVCNTCGDIGNECFLAICDRCNDGAKHTYCMRVMLDKVPEDDWMCDDCVQMEEPEKQSHDKCNMIAENWDSKYKNTAESPLTDFESILVTKEGSTETPKASNSFRNTLHRRNNSVRGLDNEKMKPAGETSSFVDCSSSDCSPKSQTGPEISPVSLAKSATEFKRINQRCDDAPAKKQLIVIETSDREFIKSVLFSRNRSDRSNVVFSKVHMSQDEKQKSCVRRDYSTESDYSDKSRNSDHDLKDESHSDSKDLDQTIHCYCNRKHYESAEVKRNRELHKIQRSANQSDEFSESSFNSKVGDVNNVGPTVTSLGERLYMRELLKVISKEAVPDIFYSWKGGFEFQTSRELPDFRDGILAHLSIRASIFVNEVVNKFPRKILLEEVPWRSIWPTEFLETSASDDDIALYFFVEDQESYRRSCRTLLKSMIKNDIAFKGNIDGTELFIFSSNLLPEKFQRLNRLFFLWGVLRGGEATWKEYVPSPKKIRISNLDENEHQFKECKPQMDPKLLQVGRGNDTDHVMVDKNN